MCVCEDSVQLADRALYLAKDLGRDRVCTSTMVRVYDAAQSLHARPDWPEGELASALLRAIGPIGPTQQEHVGPHSRMVRDLANRIGLAMPLGPEDLDHLRHAALLHDVGKLAIPEELISKPGPLSPDEKRLVDSHARFGADVCAALGLCEPVAAAVANHHDRFDWLHPTTETPTDRASLSRIISVADTFVTMTSRRPYAPRRSPTEALAEIQHERGRQFDPVVVDTIHFVDAPALAAAA